MTDLLALPKAHLHIHLEAAMRPATLRELAAAKGAPAPAFGPFDDFSDFSAAYFALVDVLDRAENVVRLIDEAVEDAAADGAVVLELAVTPDRYAEVWGSTDAALAAITEAAGLAGERHGVWVGVIVAIMRTLGPEHGDAMADAAIRFAGRGVTGLGLHAEERGFPGAPYVRAFRRAKDAGLLAVPHAGELVGAEAVREAIEVLQADRVQHGVAAIRDERLLADLAERGTCLDVCPTSNHLLGVVPDLAAHPLPALLDAGVRCSINADDPTLFGPGLLDEYRLARDVLGLSDAQLAACAASSIEASAAPEAVRTTALARIRAWNGA